MRGVIKSVCYCKRDVYDVDYSKVNNILFNSNNLPTTKNIAYHRGKEYDYFYEEDGENIWVEYDPNDHKMGSTGQRFHTDKTVYRLSNCFSFYEHFDFNNLKEIRKKKINKLNQKIKDEYEDS